MATPPPHLLPASAPSPAAASRAGLVRHLALNGLTARVSVRPEAISDRAGEAAFLDAGTHGDNRLVPASAPGTTTVPSVSIDGFCDAAGLSPDVIKIDIEGAELAALRGARRTIARAVPGEFFGEISLLDGGPRTASVIAETPVVTIRLFKASFDKVVREEPRVAGKILAVVARRLREAEKTVTA